MPLCRGSCFCSVINTLQFVMSGTKPSWEIVIPANIDFFIFTEYENPSQKFQFRSSRRSVDPVALPSVGLHALIYSVSNTELVIYAFISFKIEHKLQVQQWKHMFPKRIVGQKGRPCVPANPMSCQCVRGGVWRRLMKVLSCRVGLMALGSTLSPRRQWEHSAIILSLSLLFVDHSRNLVCFVLSSLLFFPLKDGWHVAFVMQLFCH